MIKEVLDDGYHGPRLLAQLWEWAEAGWQEWFLLYELLHTNYIHTGPKVWILMVLWRPGMITCRLFSTESLSLHWHCIIMARLCIFLSTAYYVCCILLFFLLSRYQYDLFCSSSLSPVHEAVAGVSVSFCPERHQKKCFCRLLSKRDQAVGLACCTVLYRTVQYIGDYWCTSNSTWLG
jgi:hypothetical protein